MSLTIAINELQSLLDQAKVEIASLESGRKASAPRARKHMQGLKTGSHTLRKAITEHVSTIPVKKRVAKITITTPNEVVEHVVEPVVEPVVIPPVVSPVKKSRRTKTVIEPPVQSAK